MRKIHANRSQIDHASRSIRIEAHVTQRCNARCQHCSAGVGYVSFEDTDMTPGQMKKAVDLLIEQKIRVTRFTLCGGEPVLNRHLQDLINEIDRLRTLRWGRVLSNGMPVTDDLRAKIKLPKRFTWEINPLDDPNDPLSGKNNSKKRPNRRIHYPFWISPADIGKKADFEHCTVRGWCGIGLDASGFSICGKAVMFGRMFGIDPTIKEGDILTHVRTPINEICQHCQYGLVGGKKEERAIFQRYKAGELPEVSETFQKAFEGHKEHGDLVQLELI